MTWRPACWLLVLAVATTGCSSAGERPAPVASTPASVTATLTPSAPVPAASSPPTTPRYVFPIGGGGTYGRTHAAYAATDIFATCGSTVRAVTDGVVLEVSRVDTFDINRPRGPAKGGLFVSVRGDDGVRYYGSHLSAVAAGTEAGVRVAAGATLGQVGRTGNASNICHLHFALSPPCQGAGDWWTRRGTVYPWRYLDSWRAGQRLSPVTEVVAWQRDHGCPTSQPPGEL